MDIKKSLAITLSFAAVVGILFGLDSRWTKSVVTEALSKEIKFELASSRQEFRQHEFQSTWEFLDKRMWIIRERYRNKQMPLTIREEYYDLEKRKKKIEEKLK